MGEIGLLIDAVRDRGHSVYVSGPATPEAVDAIERVLGRRLPPSYRSFLLVHGAIGVYDNFVSGVLPGGDTDCGYVLSDTETLRSDGDVPDGFVVVRRHEDGAYCLDFERQRPDGECPIVNFEFGSMQHDQPVAESFGQWLEQWLRFWSQAAS